MRLLRLLRLPGHDWARLLLSSGIAVTLHVAILATVEFALPENEEPVSSVIRVRMETRIVPPEEPAEEPAREPSAPEAAPLEEIAPVAEAAPLEEGAPVAETAPVAEAAPSPPPPPPPEPIPLPSSYSPPETPDTLDRPDTQDTPDTLDAPETPAAAPTRELASVTPPPTRMPPARPAPAPPGPAPRPPSPPPPPPAIEPQRYVEPRYPEVARRSSIQGTVVIRFRVNRRGRVEAVELKESSGSDLLDREALRTIQLWRFDREYAGRESVHRIVFKLE